MTKTSRRCRRMLANTVASQSLSRSRAFHETMNDPEFEWGRHGAQSLRTQKLETG